MPASSLWWFRWSMSIFSINVLSACHLVRLQKTLSKKKILILKGLLIFLHSWFIFLYLFCSLFPQLSVFNMFVFFSFNFKGFAAYGCCHPYLIYNLSVQSMCPNFSHIFSLCLEFEFDCLTLGAHQFIIQYPLKSLILNRLSLSKGWLSTKTFTFVHVTCILCMLH